MIGMWMMIGVGWACWLAGVITERTDLFIYAIVAWVIGIVIGLVTWRQSRP